MKKILLSSHALHQSNLSNFIKTLLESRRIDSITEKNYQDYPDIKEAEERLCDAIENKLRDAAIIAINDLRDLYKNHGKNPDVNSSGYYNMLHMLDYIGEFVITVSNNKKEGWYSALQVIRKNG